MTTITNYESLTIQWEQEQMLHLHPLSHIFYPSQWLKFEMKYIERNSDWTQSIILKRKLNNYPMSNFITKPCIVFFVIIKVIIFLDSYRNYAILVNYLSKWNLGLQQPGNNWFKLWNNDMHYYTKLVHCDCCTSCKLQLCGTPGIMLF